MLFGAVDFIEKESDMFSTIRMFFAPFFLIVLLVWSLQSHAGNSSTQAMQIFFDALKEPNSPEQSEVIDKVQDSYNKDRFIRACLKECTASFKDRIPPGKSMRCVDERACRQCSDQCTQDQ